MDNNRDETVYGVEVFPISMNYLNKLKQLGDHYAAAFESARGEYAFGLIDISDAVQLFDHLSLKKDFKIIASVQQDMHGPFSHFIAIHSELTDDEMKANFQTTWKDDDSFTGDFCWEPENSIHPMDAIENDGSMFAAIQLFFFDWLLKNLSTFSFRTDMTIVDSAPWDEDQNTFTIYTNLADWRPIAIAHRKYQTIEWELRICVIKNRIHSLHDPEPYREVCLLSYSFGTHTWNTHYEEVRKRYPKIIRRESDNKQLVGITAAQEFLLGEEIKECDSRVYWDASVRRNQEGNDLLPCEMLKVLLNGNVIRVPAPEYIIYLAERAKKRGREIYDASILGRLATMYYEGNGVPINKEKAAHWLEEAAQSGHAESQYRLAQMLYKGDEVPADKAKAAYWYEQAAKQGHNLSGHRLK